VHSGWDEGMAKYNLIIFHVPRRQQISDFMTIRNMMAGRAPDIDVHIISPVVQIPAGFWRQVGERPSLIFSPMPVKIDARLRGMRLISPTHSKSEEVEMMTRAGIPVPDTRKITKDLVLDEAAWGPFTVVKPNVGYRGRGIRLVRTRHVRWSDTRCLPADDPRHGRDLLAQRYIHTGPYARCYRVMTVLGRPIYATVSIASKKPGPIDARGKDEVDLEVAVNGVERKLTLVDDEEVIALASAVSARFTQIPVMGLDIIREHATGRLYELEMNSSGRTWHLSSDHGLGHQREFGLDCYGQFNALATITDALIEATRLMAK
jgi:hypothetical protein